MELRYRFAKLSDLPVITILFRDAVDAMLEEKIDQWDDLYPTVEDFRDDIRKKQMVIAELDKKTVAVYTLNQECDEEYRMGEWICHEKPFFVIHRLCVAPEYQNQGIAGAILRHIEKEVSALGVYSIRLDVYSQNPYALRLYHSFGYRRTGMVTWRKGDFFLMEKNIMCGSK